MARFTGKHMAAVMVGGFGIVIAVNFYMASLATSGFGGVVVKNSYVASQKYNEWLDEAERQEATGWEMAVSRDATGLVTVRTTGAPPSATLAGIARRPLGEREVRDMTFERVGDDRFVSSESLAPGRWTLRLSLQSGERKRVVETAVE